MAQKLKKEFNMKKKCFQTDNISPKWKNQLSYKFCFLNSMDKNLSKL